MNSDLSPTLSADERASLAAAEAIIESGLKTFCQVGEALAQVREGKLYKETHRSFENYCREKWQLTDSRVNQLIAASEVGLNEHDRARAGAMIECFHENARSGAEFFTRTVEPLLRLHRPDLLWIDPALS